MELATLILLFLFVFIGIVLFKIIHKIVSFVVTLMLIGCIFLGVMVYLDYRNVENNQFSNLILFMNKEKITYAAQTTGFDLGTVKELPRAEKIRLEVLLNNSDLGAVLGDNQKLVIMYETAYKKDYLELTKLFQNDTLEQIDHGLKDGNLIIYPESLYFKFIRLVPRPLVSRVS